MEVKAPAKINIGLKILSKRPDGFHNLSTLFYPLNDLYDVLTFEPSDRFEFFCDSESAPKDESNLVVKAKKLLSETTGSIINVKITLDKKIPSQAGLGGGSSDAAATLKSLNELFRLELNHQQLMNLALQLGSDVPFFIDATPSIGKSRGEILHNINLHIDEPMLIVNPMINISTKEAFQNISGHSIAIEYNNFIRNGRLDYAKMREKVENDFEKYVFGKYPEIGSIKSLMYENGALFSLMSGSGSTVYGMFSNLESAVLAAQKIPPEYFVFISNPHD
ncbi:MAG: 4-(cytidine 5'-diphospho)-2-C-methyl-D-erythritol kinase [Bacteroidetes bacterium]|nr:4-(cytidine 5'-diphospho)-2-C-methyl-D-erythritol kinase [Bacteroidota bacterium]